MSGFYEWNPSKAALNEAKHRVSFRAARRFEWAEALEEIDTRAAYGEVRCTAVSFIGERLFVMVFTRRGEKIRIISLRKANTRETTTYAKF